MSATATTSLCEGQVPRPSWRIPTGDEEVLELVRQVAKGRNCDAVLCTSLDRLMTLCKPIAASIVRTYVKNEADIADIVQQALISLTQHLHQLENPHAFPRWFSTLVHNTCRQWLRRERRRKSEISLDLCDLSLQELPILWGRAENDGCKTIEVRDILHRLLRTLPERERTTIVLTYLADKSQRDTARQMGLTPKAVENLLCRAIRRLRDTVHQCDNEVEEMDTQCPVCGEQHLSGRIQPGNTPESPLELHASCSTCAPGNYHWMALPLPFGRYSTLDGALQSGNLRFDEFVRRLLRSSVARCPVCNAPLSHERRWEGLDREGRRLHYKLSWECPRCGEGIHSSPLAVAAALPEWRAFWNSCPHLILDSQYRSRRGGEPGIAVRAWDPESGKTAVVFIEGATLRVQSLQITEP